MILRKRKCYAESCPGGQGSMVAVLGLNSENVRDLLIKSKTIDI